MLKIKKILNHFQKIVGIFLLQTHDAEMFLMAF